MIQDTLREMNIGFKSGRERFDPENPTLVMIHGAGGTSMIWQNQLFPLKNSINTIALDLPGHGDTPGPGMKQIEDYTRWLVQLLESQFASPVYLMGHSMGGAVVQGAALISPDFVKGIILAATGPRLRVAPVFLEGLKDKFEDTVDMVMVYAYAPNADKALIKEGALLMKRQGAQTVLDDFSACDIFDLSSDLEKIKLPCLILCGEEDKLTPPSLAKKLNESVPSSKLKILSAAGHMLMIENPKAFNQCVLDFIAHEAD